MEPVRHLKAVEERVGAAMEGLRKERFPYVGVENLKDGCRLIKVADPNLIASSLKLCVAPYLTQAGSTRTSKR